MERNNGDNSVVQSSQEQQAALVAAADSNDIILDELNNRQPDDEVEGFELASPNFNEGQPASMQVIFGWQYNNTVPVISTDPISGQASVPLRHDADYIGDNLPGIPLHVEPSIHATSSSLQAISANN